MKTGKLGAEQLFQLAWWQEQADAWPVFFRLEKVSLFMVCKECNRSIMNVGGYMVRIQDLTAQTVAHLRQFHREIGANGREDSKMVRGDDLAGSGSSIPDPPDRHEAKE